MDATSKDGPVYAYCEDVPMKAAEAHVETTQEEEISVTVDDEEDEEVYEEEFPFSYFAGQDAPKEVSKRPHVRRRNARFSRIRSNVSSENIDLIDLGKSVVLSTVDNNLRPAGVDRAIKAGQSDVNCLGDVSMEALVHGLMAPDAFDARFAMIGNSAMWNVLKNKMRETKSAILVRTAQTPTEPRFDKVDLDDRNLPAWPKRYDIKMVGVFANADLRYVFSMLTFRCSAKLLNKTKQFLKAYFIVSCRPRCMIWRYTMRRSGASHKKAILHLPPNIVQTIISFLLDLTGIGQGDIPFDSLQTGTPFYASLGENSAIREENYQEACQMKDTLADYFRDCIIDVLNEIREMPFCLSTGNLTTPPRGRTPMKNCVTWKQYETILKAEYEMPSKVHTNKRVEFEGLLCQAKSRGLR